MMVKKGEKTGVVVLIGRTNVGKSTLLNELLNQKVSITSRKPQTTRHRLLGIKTKEKKQIIFVDTPGFHQGYKRALNKYMNKVALSSLEGVDIILFIVESLKFGSDDKYLLSKIPENTKNVLLIINKIDKTSNKNLLLPFIKSLSESFNFSAVIPISALKGKNINELDREITSRLPFGRHLYPEDQVADTTESFLASEIIREKCITRVGDEIPYRLTVLIDKFVEKGEIIHINATLYIEKNSQKGIVIGEKGKRLKAIGTAARKDLERVLEKKVMLKLWVKVKKDWTDNREAMHAMGYKVG